MIDILRELRIGDTVTAEGTVEAFSTGGVHVRFGFEESRTVHIPARALTGYCRRTFKVGDRVRDEDTGDGTVIAVSGHFVVVEFDGRARPVVIAPDDLEALPPVAPLAAADGAAARAIANWVTGELAAELREAGEEDPASSNVAPAALAALVGMVQAKQVTHGAAKEVLSELVAQGGDPGEIVATRGLGQISDSGELEDAVERALEANPEAAEKLREGNAKAIGPIVGAVMKETKGRADGGEVTKLIRHKLGL